MLILTDRDAWDSELTMDGALREVLPIIGVVLTQLVSWW